MSDLSRLSLFLLFERTGVHRYGHRQTGELGHVLAFGHVRVVSAFLFKSLGLDRREIA